MEEVEEHEGQGQARTLTTHEDMEGWGGFEDKEQEQYDDEDEDEQENKEVHDDLDAHGTSTSLIPWPFMARVLFRGGFTAKSSSSSPGSTSVSSRLAFAYTARQGRRSFATITIPLRRRQDAQQQGSCDALWWVGELSGKTMVSDFNGLTHCASTGTGMRQPNTWNGQSYRPAHPHAPSFNVLAVFGAPRLQAMYSAGGDKIEHCRSARWAAISTKPSLGVTAVKLSTQGAKVSESHVEFTLELTYPLSWPWIGWNRCSLLFTAGWWRIRELESEEEATLKLTPIDEQLEIQHEIQDFKNTGPSRRCTKPSTCATTNGTTTDAIDEDGSADKPRAVKLLLREWLAKRQWAQAPWSMDQEQGYLRGGETKQGRQRSEIEHIRTPANPRLRRFSITFIPPVYSVSLPFSFGFLARPLTLLRVVLGDVQTTWRQSCIDLTIATRTTKRRTPWCRSHGVCATSHARGLSLSEAMGDWAKTGLYSITNNIVARGGDGGDVSSQKRTEPPRNSTQQASPSVAFLALQLPRTAHSNHFPSSPPQLTVLFRHAGPSTPTSGSPPPHLHRAPHDHPRALHKALPPDHPPTSTRALERAMHEEQDRAFTLGTQREAEAREEAERQRHREEEEEVRRVKEPMAWRRWMRWSFPQADADAGKALRLAIRLPTGQRLVHAFAAGADLTDLYAYIDEDPFTLHDFPVRVFYPEIPPQNASHVSSKPERVLGLHHCILVAARRDPVGEGVGLGGVRCWKLGARSSLRC
ncbi:hypothetical protein D9611_001284 [Ephemerocybe angulata]|uniref:UBX domain-containing protein n=1 Tax=Ephemerocybe angulata TaxID=980116 RepID=A0A8H5CKN3_9AGAR|nr:hypothetical protein D9611_001284 [Tulosesus angulatus]